MMLTIMILVFITGYTFIALEHLTSVNKTATALCTGMILWMLYSYGHPTEAVNSKIISQLGNTAEILFYLLAAMTIVETINIHQGFNGITNRMTTRNKKKLLWLIAILTFLTSSILDNLTTAIVMTMLLRKLVSDTKERWIFGSIIIISANAGGAWTPIGDVTTTMLWIHGNVTSGTIILHLLLPSLASVILPVLIISGRLKGELVPVPQKKEDTFTPDINKKERNAILISGVGCLLLVPVFKSVTGLPPFMGILLMLSLLWFYIDYLYNQKSNLPQNRQHRLPGILSGIDWQTILFFLGILLAVAALEAIGVLHELTVFLDAKIHNVYIITMIIGFFSAIIDNVPLVAAAMEMYPVVPPEMLHTLPDASFMTGFLQNGTFWELTAYCAGIGGSILIIGSAAGVVVMGLERINFIWYMKNISPVTILGYLAGIGVYILQKTVF